MIPYLVGVLACTAAIAAIPQRSADGAVIAPSGTTFHVRLTAYNPSRQHEAWRAAVSTINAVAGSALRIVEDPVTATPTEPALGDGINSIAVMHGTDWPFFEPEMPYVFACLASECDVWFNAVTFNIVGSSGSYAYDRYYDAESLALSALLRTAARFDSDVRFERVLYSHPPYGAGRTRLTLDESTALQATFGTPPPAQVLRGTVRRQTAAVAYAYVCACLLGGGEDVCVTSASDGTYTLRLPAAGSYRVVVTPLTTNPAYLYSSAYRTNDPRNVNFLAEAYPAPVSLGAGQTVSGIDFDVSPTASPKEPSELQEPLDLPTDGTPITFNTWPCGDRDTATFRSEAGTCYAIGTRATGIAAQSEPPGLERSATSLTLEASGTVLAQNVSRNGLDDDPRSWLLFCETAPRLLTVSVQQRQPAACGAGFHFELSVVAVPSLPRPHIDAPSPSRRVVARAALRELFSVSGRRGSQVQRRDRERRAPGNAAAGLLHVDHARHRRRRRHRSLPRLLPERRSAPDQRLPAERIARLQRCHGELRARERTSLHARE